MPPAGGPGSPPRTGLGMSADNKPADVPQFEELRLPSGRNAPFRGRGSLLHSLQFRINLISLLSGALIATGLVIAGGRVISTYVNEELETHAHIAAQDLVDAVQSLKVVGVGFDSGVGLDEECREVVGQCPFLLYAGIYDLQGKLRFSSGGADIGWPGAADGRNGVQLSRKGN